MEISSKNVFNQLHVHSNKSEKKTEKLFQQKNNKKINIM